VAFRLQPGEPVAEAIRRVVAEQVDNAVAQLEGRGEADRDAAVHDARKSLKKARAAVRLARFDLGDEVRMSENAVLRDAGRRLSGVRDAEVLLQTLAKVAADERLAVPPEAVARLRIALEQRRDRLHAQAHDAAGESEAAAAELRALRERVASWPLEDAGFASAGRGLRRIHERGAAAMDAAVGPDADDEAWHEWRKRVKDLWYSVRILEPVSPRLLGGLVAEASELSDLLGDHNDLAVLSEAVEEHRAVLEPEEAAALAAAVHRRAGELRLRAVPLGLRLYAESPKALARRVRAYWTAMVTEAAVEALDPG